MKAARVIVLACVLSCGGDRVTDPRPVGFFSLERLDLPIATSSVFALNKHGVVAGTVMGTDSRTRPFRYKQGVLSVLALPTGVRSVEGGVMNDASDIAAQLDDGRPVLWISGVEQPIVLTESFNRPRSITNDGKILLQGLESGPIVVWNGSALEVLPGVSGRGWALNNLGDLLYSQDFLSDWNVLAARLLQPYAPMADCPGEGPVGGQLLNDSAYVVAHKGIHKCLFRPGKPVLLLDFHPQSINSKGWVSGYVPAEAQNTQKRARLWVEGTLLPWEELFASGSELDGWVMWEFIQMNESGQILAIAFRGGIGVEGERGFLLLTPKS